MLGERPEKMCLPSHRCKAKEDSVVPRNILRYTDRTTCPWVNTSKHQLCEEDLFGLEGVRQLRQSRQDGNRKQISPSPKSDRTRAAPRKYLWLGLLVAISLR